MTKVKKVKLERQNLADRTLLALTGRDLFFSDIYHVSIVIVEELHIFSLLVRKQSLGLSAEMLDVFRHFLVCSRSDDPIDFSGLAKLKQDPHLLVVIFHELFKI